jgi:hypothetical protein
MRNKYSTNREARAKSKQEDRKRNSDGRACGNKAVYLLKEKLWYFVPNPEFRQNDKWQEKRKYTGDPYKQSFFCVL